MITQQMYWFYIFFITLLLSGDKTLLANDFQYKENLISQKSFPNKLLEVENCLMSCYGVTSKSAASISFFLHPLIANEKYYPIIDAFIEKSKNLAIDFSAIPSQILSPNDGVLKAPQWHTVLFESPHVRILRGTVKSGECDPFHLHQWKRLMVVIQEAEFKTEYFDGTIEIEDCPIGIEELEPEHTPSAYTNIGNTIFEALVFEVKE